MDYTMSQRLKIPGKTIGSRLSWALYKKYYLEVVSRYEYKMSDALRDAVSLHLEVVERGLKGEDVGEYVKKWLEEWRTAHEE